MLDLDVIIGITLVVSWLSVDCICEWWRYRAGFDCDKCKDWSCPYHWCMKRKQKNMQP